MPSYHSHSAHLGVGADFAYDSSIPPHGLQLPCTLKRNEAFQLSAHEKRYSTRLSIQKRLLSRFFIWQRLEMVVSPLFPYYKAFFRDCYVSQPLFSFLTRRTISALTDEKLPDKLIDSPKNECNATVSNLPREQNWQHLETSLLFVSTLGTTSFRNEFRINKIKSGDANSSCAVYLKNK